MIAISLERPSQQGKKRCVKIIGTTHLIGSIRSGVDCYVSPHMGVSQYILIGKFSELTALTPPSTIVCSQGHHQTRYYNS